MFIQLLRITLVVIVLLFNLLIAVPSRAETPVFLISTFNDFEVGQKVIWLYKARPDSNDVRRIPAEVVKIGSKQVQIKVKRSNDEFVNRWVSLDKLENLYKIKEP